MLGGGLFGAAFYLPACDAFPMGVLVDQGQFE